MTARTSRRYGGDVDEGTVALIRFPDERLAHFHSSFGEEPGVDASRCSARRGGSGSSPPIATTSRRD